MMNSRNTRTPSQPSAPDRTDMLELFRELGARSLADYIKIPEESPWHGSGLLCADLAALLEEDEPTADVEELACALWEAHAGKSHGIPPATRREHGDEVRTPPDLFARFYDT